MALLQKIRTLSRRIVQLEGGTGNNQPARASDVNPIINWINNRSDVNTVANAVTTTGTTAQVGTLNAISGTITSATLTNTVSTPTSITITDAYCTSSSTVLCQISAATVGTGGIFIQSVVASNGSFVINLYNPIALTGTASVSIKFIIL